MNTYIYRARPVRVIDGDTLDVDVDLGFHIFTRQRLRLLGIDTPEIYGREASPRGAAAKERVEELVMLEEWLLIATEKSDSFGRYLAEVYLPSGRKLGQILLDEGLAEVYRKR